MISAGNSVLSFTFYPHSKLRKFLCLLPSSIFPLAEQVSALAQFGIMYDLPDIVLEPQIRTGLDAIKPGLALARNRPITNQDTIRLGMHYDSAYNMALNLQIVRIRYA